MFYLALCQIRAGIYCDCVCAWVGLITRYYHLRVLADPSLRFLNGTYVAGFVSPIYMLGDTTDVGQRVGMFLLIAAVSSICGPQFTDAINNAGGGFEGIGFYAGGTMIVASAFMILTKRIVIGRFWGRY